MAAIAPAGNVPLTVDPVSRSIALKSAGIRAASWLSNVLERAGRSNPFVYMASQAALYGAAYLGYKKQQEIHRTAEQENPRRSRLMSCLTHPVTKATLASILYFHNLGLNASIHSGVMPPGALERMAPSMVLLNGLALLPELANLYEVGKRSLRGLAGCWNHRAATIREKLQTAAVYIGNLTNELCGVGTQLQQIRLASDPQALKDAVIAEGNKVPDFEDFQKLRVPLEKPLNVNATEPSVARRFAMPGLLVDSTVAPVNDVAQFANASLSR